MDNLESYEYIELQDEDTTLKLRLLDSFGVDQKDYAALLDEDKEELYILEVIMKDNEATFKSIDSKKEYDKILDIYNDLLDDFEEDRRD